MSFDYFYGQQSDLFTFYRVPKVLFTNERFWNISADAKMLYGILLDRMSLSAKNGWIDKNGRVYIIFTIDEAKMALNCAEQKASAETLQKCKNILSGDIDAGGYHCEVHNRKAENCPHNGMYLLHGNALSQHTTYRCLPPLA